MTKLKKVEKIETDKILKKVRRLKKFKNENF